MTAEVGALAPFSGRHIAVDARWVGRGGPGRVTATLLAGLRDLQPPGNWLLWGDEETLRPYTWPGATIRHTTLDPKKALGQASTLACPRADLLVFLHHWRPLLIRSRAVTLLHDSIPLRLARRGPRGWLLRGYYRLTVRSSDAIVTVSEPARQQLAADAGVAAAKLHVVPPALDPGLAERIRKARTPGDANRTEIVAIGRFAAHKNLRRLALAFAREGLAAEGWTLRCIGGSDEEIAELSAWLARRSAAAGIRLEGYLSDEALVSAVASARGLAAVSLDEGFGLPAFEAAAGGVPVLASSAGAMGDIPPSNAVFCEPTSVASIAAGLRTLVVRPEPEPWERPYSVRDQALRFCLAIAPALTGGR